MTASGKRRNKELTVWRGNYDGVREALVATFTEHEAIKALGVGYRGFKDYFSSTTAEEEVIVACAAPGTVFIKPMNKRNAAWVERGW